MSTFAEAHLRDMTVAQMAQFDLFLDENDWDIYYWATQEPSPTSRETAEGAGPGPEGATPNARGTEKGGLKLETDEWRQGKARSGEWAQTIGTFKPAYRPVPARWKNSEILGMLRRHVISRSAGGVLEGVDVGSDGANQAMKGTGGGGKSSSKDKEGVPADDSSKEWLSCHQSLRLIDHEIKRGARTFERNTLMYIISCSQEQIHCNHKFFLMLHIELIF
jgi:hypothetical protein